LKKGKTQDFKAPNHSRAGGVAGCLKGEGPGKRGLGVQKTDGVLGGKKKKVAPKREGGKDAFHLQEKQQQPLERREMKAGKSRGQKQPRRRTNKSPRTMLVKAKARPPPRPKKDKPRKGGEKRKNFCRETPGRGMGEGSNSEKGGQG